MGATVFEKAGGRLDPLPPPLVTGVGTKGLEKEGLILFSMGYFKNTMVWGALPPPNVVVFNSITIKFGVLIEFDKFSPK